MTTVESQPMKPGEYGRFVCVAHGGCLHRHRTITRDGVWVRSPDPDALDPGSHLYSSAHRDCFEAWQRREARETRTAQDDRDRELLAGTPWEGNPHLIVRHGVIHDTRYDQPHDEN